MVEIIIKIFKSGDEFLTHSMQLPGLSAFGETREEALKEFAIALQGYMEVMIEDGEKLVEKGG